MIIFIRRRFCTAGEVQSGTQYLEICGEYLGRPMVFLQTGGDFPVLRLM